MRVKLDNSTGDPESVLVTTTSCEEAREDQSIMGSKWECDGEDFGYTIITDDDFLVPNLKKEGYEVDVSDYDPPCLRAEGDGTRCPECGAEDPFHPKKKDCETCRAMATQDIEHRELTIGGWDPTP